MRSEKRSDTADTCPHAPKTQTESQAYTANIEEINFIEILQRIIKKLERFIKFIGNYKFYREIPSKI